MYNLANVHHINRKKQRIHKGMRYSRLWITAVAILSVITVLLTGIIMLQISHTEAADSKNLKIYYKSVYIQTGDSLWSIAEDNMTPEYDNIRDYIREIKRLNQISSDKIHAGAYLVVPYYVSGSHE